MKLQEYRLSKNRITHTCCYHIVWCSTFRRPVLTDQMQIRLKGLIEEVSNQQQIEILELQVMPNCVYLHCDMPPTESVNVLIRRIKRHTSSVLCKEFPKLRSRLPSLWTLHYFVSTEQKKPEAAIRDWMETQPRCQKENR